MNVVLKFLIKNPFLQPERSFRCRKTFIDVITPKNIDLQHFQIILNYVHSAIDDNKSKSFFEKKGDFLINLKCSFSFFCIEQLPKNKIYYIKSGEFIETVIEGRKD